MYLFLIVVLVCCVGSPGLLMGLGSPVERPESSEILDQLLSQGIIPEAPARDRGSGAGPAYDIMVGQTPPPPTTMPLKHRLHHHRLNFPSILVTFLS